MFNICYRMVNNMEEAEDMLQEAFTDAFIKLESFRYESSFGAWLKRIVINKCINWIQKRKIELMYPENFESMEQEEEQTVDYEGIQMDVSKIHQAIEKLPDGYRVIFSLYALEGYDHSEISEILGVSESTSKTQYLRAKQKIKEILKSNGNETRQVRTVYS